jgi:hypothetical protein
MKVEKSFDLRVLNSVTDRGEIGVVALAVGTNGVSTS